MTVAGTSGGIWGLQVGYCLMVGGDAAAVDPLAPVFTSLAPPGGYLHVGGPGAGHYVKMVHNGIEYGLMQAYAEGFEILHASDYDLDLGAISELWMQGSVVRSWLLELAGRAFKANGQDLEHLKGFVADSGEGRWTVQRPSPESATKPLMCSRSAPFALNARAASSSSHDRTTEPCIQRSEMPARSSS